MNFPPEDVRDVVVWIGSIVVTIVLIAGLITLGALAISFF